MCRGFITWTNAKVNFISNVDNYIIDFIRHFQGSLLKLFRFIFSIAETTPVHLYEPNVLCNLMDFGIVTISIAINQYSYVLQP